MLLSSNTLEILNKIMKRIEISPSLFSKYDFFKELISSRDIAAHEVLSIGDRYMTDIAPVLMLGGRGVLVKGVYSLRRILEDMDSGGLKKDSGAYNYYTDISA